MGNPMAPGTRLMSPDGAVGVVTDNNTVTISYPQAGFYAQQQRHGKLITLFSK